MKYSEHWLAILMGVLVTPIIFALGVLMSGGGHSFTSMIVLFPYGMFLGLLFGGKLFWFLIGLPAFALQYPLYGLALGGSMKKPKPLWLPTILLVAHILMALMAIATRDGLKLAKQ
jgi:hypothetical protein